MLPSRTYLPLPSSSSGSSSVVEILCSVVEVLYSVVEVLETTVEESQLAHLMMPALAIKRLIYKAIIN